MTRHRIALVSDIHANDVALERVLNEIDSEGIELVVCLGDVAATGPQPRQALARLRMLEPLVVMGNADAFLLSPARVGDDDFMRKIADIDSWCADQLEAADLDYIRSFKPTVEVSLEEGKRLVCYHGSPASFDDSITATTPDDKLERLLSATGADVAAGGHTHFQMLRHLGVMTVVNPGSVGLAYNRTHPPDEIRLAPWAEYAVISVEEGRSSIAFRRVSFDVGRLVSAIEGSSMPHAGWLASEWRR